MSYFQWDQRDQIKESNKSYLKQHFPHFFHCYKQIFSRCGWRQTTMLLGILKHRGGKVIGWGGEAMQQSWGWELWKWCCQTYGPVHPLFLSLEIVYFYCLCLFWFRVLLLCAYTSVERTKKVNLLYK